MKTTDDTYQKFTVALSEIKEALDVSRAIEEGVDERTGVSSESGDTLIEAAQEVHQKVQTLLDLTRETFEIYP